MESNINHLTERSNNMGKLQDQMKRDMELKNLSPRTVQTYLFCMREFVRHHGRTPEELGDEEIKQYLH